METDPTGPTDDDAPPSPVSGQSWIRNLVPWLGALGIFAYLFWEVPFEEAWLAARDARLDLFVPEVLAAAFFWFLIDSRTLSYLFTRFNTPVSWSEARSIRGVSYLLTALNWNAGTAGIIVHLRRFKGIPALESTGSMLFYQYFDGFILVGLALLGASAFAESATLETIQRVTGIVFLVQLMIFAILTTSYPSWNWLSKIRQARIVKPFRSVNWADAVFFLSFKLAYFMVFIWIFWAGSHAFGVEVPFGVVLASAPAVMMVATIPIAPAGLGTQAAAMLFFWSEYGEKAEILAFGLVFPIALVLARCLLGLFYLGDLRSTRRSDENSSSLGED